MTWPDSTASRASVGLCVPRPAAWVPSSLPDGVISTFAPRLWATWARMSAAAWLTRPFQITTGCSAPASALPSSLAGSVAASRVACAVPAAVEMWRAWRRVSRRVLPTPTVITWAPAVTALRMRSSTTGARWLSSVSPATTIAAAVSRSEIEAI